jgi:uncharacterized membrane protein (DUF2068 family)
MVTLPLRGRPLRDRYVLRLIAVDRLIHFLVLSALAAAVFLFASNKAALNADFTGILKDLQGGLGGPVNTTHSGIVRDLQRLFAVNVTNLYLVGVGIAAYAVLEGVEAVGLWLGRRWAEYLTFVATVVFVPYEVYELTKSVSVLKVLALVINVAIVVYLLVAKRLFGRRGGGKAERAEYARDTGSAPFRAGHARPGRFAADAGQAPALTKPRPWHGHSDRTATMCRAWRCGRKIWPRRRLTRNPTHKHATGTPRGAPQRQCQRQPPTPMKFRASVIDRGAAG